VSLGPHAAFILAAYASAAVVVAALVAWVMADHRAQRRVLADLETKGIARRSRSEGAQGVDPA
jgi:heme exporter protein D